MPYTCIQKDCKNKVFAKSLCLYHWRPIYQKPIARPVFKHVTLRQSDEVPAKPFKVYRTAEIKKVSTRQQKLNTAYLALRKAFMKAHRVCEAGLQDCTIQATECHHKRGRGEFLLDDSTYMALCSSCHQFIETHPAFAMEKGFSQSRLAKVI